MSMLLSLGLLSVGMMRPVIVTLLRTAIVIMLDTAIGGAGGHSRVIVAGIVLVVNRHLHEDAYYGSLV